MGGKRGAPWRGTAAVALAVVVCGGVLSAPARPVAADPGPPGGLRAALPYQASAGDPVNTLTGNFAYRHTDLAIAGRGPSPVFSRSYNSLDTRSGALGPGWLHSYEVRLNDPNDSTADLVLTRSSGQADRFTYSGGAYTPPRAVDTTLVKNGDNTFTATDPDQTVWTFRTDGRLQAITDRYGNQSRLSYNELGQLLLVGDPAGRGTLRLAYDPTSGRLTSVTDWASPARTVRYQYDANGRLWKAIDRENQVTTYGYDGTSSRLTTITDARGHVALTLTYDDPVHGHQGRVVRQQDARGLLTGAFTAFAYVVQADGSQRTTITYPPSPFAPGFDSVTEDTYDPLGRIVRRVYQPAPGETVDERYAYDESWKRSAVTDPQGNPITRAAEQPDYGVPLQGCGVDPADLANVAGLAGGGAAPAARLLPLLWAVPPPASYEGGGEVSPPREVVDGAGTTVAYEYDRIGRATTIHVRPPGDAAGQRWQLAYDLEDRLRVVETSPAGPDGTPVRFEFRYDAVGNRTVVIGPHGQLTRCLYDERDALSEIQRSLDPWTDPDQEPAHLQVTRLEYDDRGDLLRVTGDAGVLGIAAAGTGGGGAPVTEYQHDGLHRLRRIIRYPDWPDTSTRRVTDLAYDARGRQTIVRSDP
jgi:YD repeat-containing protein